MQRLFFLLIFMVPFQVLSQWQEHLIYEDSIAGSAKLILVDIDNDGLQDIVTFRGQSAIYWHKNLGGAGNFSPPILIAQNIQNLTYFVVGDLTGNGYKDIVFTAPNLTTPGLALRWMEHLDGNGTFGTPQIIPENPTTRARAIVLADIDGDGMLDIVVSASADSDRSITWYRNLGSGNFSSGNVVITNFSNGFGIAVGDINGNGFLDIVSGTPNFQTMAWFENLDGQGNFSGPIEIGSTGIAVLYMHLIDIDGDGVLDIVGSSSGANHKFSWWENLDGEGAFSSENFIELDHLITAFYPADIDNDGDIDLFAIRPGTPGFMYWYENLDGLGNFSNPHLITNNLTNSVTLEAADINGNGMIDVVTATQTTKQILWYENQLLSITENEINNFILYPNPVEDTLKIKFDLLPVKFTIFNSSGQKLFEKKWKPGQKEIDVSSLSSGMYVVEFIYPNFKQKIKFIKK